MTHRRKTYIVYPPNYVPPMKYYLRYSKLQAWKLSRNLGVGAHVSISINRHPKNHAQWEGSEFKPLYDVVDT
jgi:hypothetical protein